MTRYTLDFGTFSIIATSRKHFPSLRNATIDPSSKSLRTTTIREQLSKHQMLIAKKERLCPLEVIKMFIPQPGAIKPISHMLLAIIKEHTQ